MSTSSSIYLMKEGKNHLPGERGCLLAKYVDGMMNLAFNVDDRGFVHNCPSFTREYVNQMYLMITSYALSSHWDYDRSQRLI